MKKYIGAILSIGTVAMLFYTLFDLKNQVKQIPVLEHQLDSVSIIKDSLYEVNFINERIIPQLLILHHHYGLYPLGLLKLMLSHVVKKS